MARYRAIIYIRLKPGYSDPEGETTARALRGLGYDIVDVRSSKAYEVTLEAGGEGEARRLVDEMCHRLLTNPTKDEYRFDLTVEQ